MKVRNTFPYRVRDAEHVWIPMSDGVRLSARIWTPEKAEETPVPAVLEYIPYRKRDLTRLRDSAVHPYFAGHGYASVRVDLRGSGDSEGVLEDEYLERELADGEEILRWLGEQPWCDGNVGMIGISWGGFNGLQIAARQPPELKAIITVCSSDGRYADDVHYMGGCLLGDNLAWASVMFGRNACPPDPQVVGDDWRRMWLDRLQGSGLWVAKWLRHQRRDEYWKHGSIREDYSSVSCPVFAVSGWADGYSNAVFRLMENLDVPRRGLIGPWSHLYPHVGMPGPAIGFLQECLQWWDQWLRGEDQGIGDEPMLRVWMQDSVPPTTSYQQRPGRWVSEATWPSQEIESTEYALAPHGKLVATKSDGTYDAGYPGEVVTIQSPITVGLFAGKWCSYAYAPDLPHDQREEDGGALVFETPPLEEALEILGVPVVELKISANKPSAMVAVRLSEVARDDKATRVSYGLLNLTHRDSHERPEPLEPDRVYTVRVSLNGLAQTFPKGHRIRLSISTSYWPLAWPSPEPARLSIDTAGSALLLPRRPPREEQLRAFGEAEGAKPIKRTTVQAPRYDWFVHRNLATDESTLEVIADDGLYRINEVDLEVANRIVEHWVSWGDDFHSVRGEVTNELQFRRDDWLVRIVTHTLLTCTREAFRVRAELDAYEGRTRVFANSWDEHIPRDGV